MTERLYVHLPFRFLKQYLPFILEHRLQSEIAFLATDFAQPIEETLQQLARELSRAGLALISGSPPECHP